MKTIAALKGADFLRACNAVRYEAQALIRETGVLEIRKHLPVIPDNATDETRAKLLGEQSQKNISDMLDVLLDKHAEATYKFLEKVVVPEDGDGELDGIDMLTAALELISSPKVIDFLSRLAKLALTNTAA